MKSVEDRRRILFRVLIVAVPVVFFGAIILISNIFIGRIGKIKTTIVYAPYASTVKVDGEQVTNNGDNWLTPGKHRMTVEFENFNSVEREIDIQKEGSIHGSLTPANKTGVEYMNNHIFEFSGVEAIAAKEEDEFGEQMHNKFPVMSKVPYKDPFYTISYEMPDTNTFYFIIKATPSYMGAATMKLMEIVSKEDIEQYDVVIKELNSPFAGVQFNNNAERDPETFLRTGYGSAFDGFSVGRSKIVNGYYYAFIRKYDGYIPIVYRVILKLKGSSWELCGTPYPVLTGVNTPNVPMDIIYSVDTDDYDAETSGPLVR